MIYVLFCIARVFVVWLMIWPLFCITRVSLSLVLCRSDMFFSRTEDLIPVLFVLTNSSYWCRGVRFCPTRYLPHVFASLTKLWARTPLRRGALDTTLCDKVCQWFAAGRWFSPGTPVFSTNKTDSHDINKILLKLALNIITLTLCG
jgi:hypothetical protein